ncbi:hypothetical protein BVC80_8865g19 [Macleaya cordata]|uniref:Auxin response factor n=1 Tax=Macleaya cordata TaxID=56857 RepID=A0A200Q6P0_MACCD|nr:hypothetical protein BVC80_8865g19 [Macleaya cordata]
MFWCTPWSFNDRIPGVDFRWIKMNAFSCSAVAWEEPKVLQNEKRVSPWQVELVATTPSLQTPFPQTKRLRGPQNPELLTDGNGALFFPMTGLTNSMMGHLNSPLLSYNSFPAGMQGARHDVICLSGVSNSVDNNTNHMLYPEHVSVNNISPISSSVATDMNIRGISQSDNLSPNSQSSVHYFGTEPLGNQTYNSTKKAGSSSFQLFGKIIYTDQAVETGSDDGRSTDVDGGTGYDETVGVINPLDPSLSYPY